MKMEYNNVSTWWAAIHIAGDYEQAKQVCREHCRDVLLCVTVTPTTYIYTGGEESGVIVRLINYPRFPAERTEIRDTAFKLAEKLRTRLCQWSWLVETPDATYWDSNRPAD